MVNYTEQIKDSFSMHLALYSFMGGTFLLILHILFKLEIIINIGLIYVIIAVIINLIMLMILVFQLVLYNNKKFTLMKIGAILCNIPISILYTYIILTFNIK